MSHARDHHHRHYKHHKPHHHYQAQQPHQQRTAGRAAGGFASATAAGAVPLEERLFGQGQVRRIAEEAFATLPENKLALLSIGFMAGGAASMWMHRSHADRVAETRQLAGAIAR